MLTCCTLITTKQLTLNTLRLPTNQRSNYFARTPASCRAEVGQCKQGAHCAGGQREPQKLSQLRSWPGPVPVQAQHRRRSPAGRPAPLRVPGRPSSSLFLGSRGGSDAGPVSRQTVTFLQRENSSQQSAPQVIGMKGITRLAQHRAAQLLVPPRTKLYRQQTVS